MSYSRVITVRCKNVVTIISLCNFSFFFLVNHWRVRKQYLCHWVYSALWYFYIFILISGPRGFKRAQENRTHKIHSRRN